MATSPCVFTIQLTGSIALTASTTQINNATAGVSLVIEGGGFAVNGPGTSGSVRPFDIAANTTVKMNKITITGGNATGSGGGISNSGILTLANSTISGNNAANNGGGIYNVGTLTVTDSTITGNQATNSGGGVYSNALTGTPVLITGSTIYNNNAYFEYGGGVANVGGEMTIRNSTISGNKVSVSVPVKEGGGIYNESRLTLDSVTITDNERSALYNASYGAAQVTIQNSILANSTNITYDCVNVTPGTVTIVNPNLVETQNNCGSFTLTSDPQLGPLQNNGGPTQDPRAAGRQPGHQRRRHDADHRPAQLRTPGRRSGRHRRLRIRRRLSRHPGQLRRTSPGRPRAGDVADGERDEQRRLQPVPHHVGRRPGGRPADLVPSQAPGSTQGFVYTYQDNAVTPGETYWYWLEDVDLSGVTTLHGPVSVVYTAPTAVTLSGLEAAGDGSHGLAVAAGAGGRSPGRRRWSGGAATLPPSAIPVVAAGVRQ